jgi:hypothetical protein
MILWMPQQAQGTIARFFGHMDSGKAVAKPLDDLSRLMRDPAPVRCKGGALGAAFALSGGGGLRQESAAQAANTNSV